MGSLALAREPYEPYTKGMSRKSLGAEEARTLLPELLEQARHGVTTLITKRGQPYAELGPVAPRRTRKSRSLLQLAGTGAGLWSRDDVRRQRDEWE